MDGRIRLHYWDMYLTKGFQTVCQIFHCIKESQVGSNVWGHLLNLLAPAGPLLKHSLLPGTISRWTFTVFKDWAFLWTLSCMSTPLLKWEAQSWQQCSRCGLPSAIKRRITSLQLLAILCLKQPRMVFTFFAAWVHFFLFTSPFTALL